MKYDDWLDEVTQIFDRKRENFDEFKGYGFRADWKHGLTPRESFDRAMSFK